jgi:hypothetical protein
LGGMAKAPLREPRRFTTLGAAPGHPQWLFCSFDGARSDFVLAPGPRTAGNSRRREPRF